MTDIIKICKKHGGLKKEDIWTNGKSKYYSCKICKNEYQKKYRKINKPRPQAYNAEWSKKYRSKPERIQKRRKYRKKVRDDLRDDYIKQKIVRNSNLKISDIPKELIELKRD